MRRLAGVALLLLYALTTVALGTPSTTGEDPVLELTSHSTTSDASIEGSNRDSEQSTLAISQDEPDEDPRFWRELGKDEPVPVGSHVRINMSTERKYVKRDLEAERLAALEETTTSLSGNEEEGEDRVSTMERVLYGLPDVDPRLPDASARDKMSREEYEAALSKIWKLRQEEIRDSIEAMEDEPALVTNLTLILAEASLDTVQVELLDALVDLEWFVQDLDHAAHFSNIGGLDFCVKLLSHQDSNVRQLAAHVSGNAAKSNEAMQTKALQAGLLTKAMNRLVELLPCEASEAESVGKECNKMLYAISSSTRHFKAAQTEATANGLTEVLESLITSPTVDTRAQVKALALIADSLTQWDACWSEESVSNLCEALEQKAQRFIAENPNHESLSPVLGQVHAKLAEAAVAARCQSSTSLAQILGAASLD